MHSEKLEKSEKRQMKLENHKLKNKYDKKTLEDFVRKESFERLTLSFYRYVRILDPAKTRDELYEVLSQIKILGRIYLAKEGINAQISVPVPEHSRLRTAIDSIPEFKGVNFNEALENNKFAFLKLAIKVRKKIVADGLDSLEYNPTLVGKHLTPIEFHEALNDPQALVIDFRNNYESEVGHFENAICPDVGTFREELPFVENLLKGEPKDRKLLLYCTGGIRCEKASAYLKQKGFQDVNQLLGGIVSYTKVIKEKGLQSKFKGKNFVFDDRLGERVTDDVLTVCYLCKKTSDRHTNCANLGCHVLFVQCEDCAAKFENCCSTDCKSIIHLPIEEQKQLRKLNPKHSYATHHLTLKDMENRTV